MSFADRLLVPRQSPHVARWGLTVLRAGSAVVFVGFGVGKFVNHASETASFETYGLPAPDVFTLAIGVLELVGGVLLMAGLATRLIGLLLAGDMVGAIVVSGVLHGEDVSLTLAPLLLVVMLALVIWGPGAAAADNRLFMLSPRPGPWPRPAGRRPDPPR